MNEKNILETLGMTRSQFMVILRKTWSQYLKYLTDIASDIYDSCIQLYYATYDPVKYDRHGDIRGFNLYNANDITSDDIDIDLNFDEWSLLPYTGKEKRDIILKQVVDQGIRGGGSRSKGSKWKDSNGQSWPMSWKAYYPNEYSKYTFWKSNKRTMDGIYTDFKEQIIDVTDDKFLELFINNL